MIQRISSLIIAACPTVEASSVAPVRERIALERIHHRVPCHLWAAPWRDACHALHDFRVTKAARVRAILRVVKARRCSLACISKVLFKIVVRRQTLRLRVAEDVVHDVAVVELLVLWLHIDVLRACGVAESSLVVSPDELLAWWEIHFLCLRGLAQLCRRLEHLVQSFHVYVLSEVVVGWVVSCHYLANLLPKGHVVVLEHCFIRVIEVEVWLVLLLVEGIH